MPAGISPLDWVALAWLTAGLGFVLRELYLYIRAPQVTPEDSYRDVESSPPVTLIIPARNEADSIGETLDAVLDLEWDELEILVINDASEDETGEIARRRLEGETNARVITLSEADRPEDWAGKRFALSRGEELAQGEWIAFVDADVRLHPRCLHACFAQLQELNETDDPRGAVDLLSLAPKQRAGGTFLRLLQPAVYQLLDGLMDYRENNSEGANDPVVSGGFLLARRAALEAAGGHAELDAGVLIDTELARKLHREGYRIHFARGEHLVSVEMYTRPGEALTGWRKNFWAMLGAGPADRLSRSVAIFWFWLLPAVLTLAELATGGLSWGALALGGQIFFDGTLRLSKGHAFLPALLSPLAGLLLLYLYWSSLYRLDRGEGFQWKGRLSQREQT